MKLVSWSKRKTALLFPDCQKVSDSRLKTLMILGYQVGKKKVVLAKKKRNLKKRKSDTVVEI